MREETVADEMTDTQKDKFLSFELDNQEYAFEIRYVGEIIGIQKITPLPDVPNYVKGVINLRGRVIPLVDVRLRLGLNERPYDDRTCIVVANVNNNVVGLIVDTVDEVLDIQAGQIEEPPDLKKSNQSHFLQGLAKVNEQVKILLNVEQFLFDTALE